MTAFKEFAIGKFVLRFYKTDHVWTCTVTEDMLDEVKKELALQKLSDIGQEIETLDTRSYLIGRYDKVRELSDEEILELSNTMPYANRFEFARAILKKAQEK